MHYSESLDAANNLLLSEGISTSVSYEATPDGTDRESIASQDIVAACTVLSTSEETVALQEAFADVQQLHNMEESGTVDSANGVQITDQEISYLRQAVAMHVAVVLLTAKIASRVATKVEPAEFKRQFVETARHIFEDIYVHGRAFSIALGDYTNESIVRSVTGDDSHQVAPA